MTDYFVGTEAEVQDLATKTLTYAKPIKHKGKVNTYYCIIKEVYSPLIGRQFTIEEIDAAGSAKEKIRTTLATLDSEGARPTSSVLTV